MNTKPNKPKYWVTTTDKFMSGWGHARGLTNKLVFECGSYDQAAIVAANAENRSDQKYVNICSKKPYYSASRYYVQIKTIEDYPTWYQAGAFRKSA